MKTLLKSTLVASMVSAGAWSVALADGHSTGHYYIGIQGAVGPVLSDSDFFAPTSNAAQPLNGDVESDDAFLIGIQGGMFLDENWRIGGEIYYTGIDPSQMNIENLGGGLVVGLDGDVRAITVFADVAYETNLFDKLNGFIEAGVGFSNINLDNVQTGANFNGFIDDSDTVLMGKIGVGTTYELTENVEWFSEYNYVFGQDADLAFTAPGAALASVPFELETDQHVFMFGLRMKLN